MATERYMTTPRDHAINRVWDDFHLGHLNCEELNAALRAVWDLYPLTKTEEAARQQAIDRDLADLQRLVEAAEDERT